MLAGALTLGVASPALAGTTGDVEWETDTDTDTGDDSSSASDPSCGGEKCSATIPTITSPLDGATVGTTFVLVFNAPDACTCDTCGCYYEPIDSVGIHVDGESVAGCGGDQACMTKGVELTLAPGEHTIQITAQHTFDAESSEPITVHVEGEPDSTGTDSTTGMESTTSSDSTSSSGGMPSTDDSSGGTPTSGVSAGSEGSGESSTANMNEDDAVSSCGCTSAKPTPAALAMLLLAPLAFRRRRR